MKKKKTILAITGIRSDYDILFPVLDESRRKGHKVFVVVSGAHLSEKFGLTVNNIISDGFEIADRIDSLFSTDRNTQRSKGVGALITGLSQTVERLNPDIMVYVGDREEGIAASVVANYSETLLLHICGGDPVWGNSDDPVRFAISKLAHVHCVTHPDHVNNLINMGEEEFRIFHTGNPSYVNIDNISHLGLDEVYSTLELPSNNKNYVVLIQHPLSSEYKEAEFQIKITLDALEKFCIKNNYMVISIASNSDPGSEAIRNSISSYKNDKWLFSYESIDREIFINLIRNAKALIGNSSMGILEAPHYKLPVVNVGNRQMGRLNAGNVEFVEHDIDQVVCAIEKACLDKNYRKKITNITNPYGDGSAAKNIVKVIEDIDTSNRDWYIKRKLVP
jgi:GDP/UDP-N,N'-diacetylbacillosamine 2-epimerase (hydrolysing)